MYVFDTSPLSALISNFYPGRFPTLWNRFDSLVDADEIVSTREVLRELDRYSKADENWKNRYRGMFRTPTAAEARFVGRIYTVRHFQHNIELKKIQKGGLNADPFVIALAEISGGTVVTLEGKFPNAAKIPNICDHFNIPCLNLEEFMEVEGWRF